MDTEMKPKTRKPRAAKVPKAEKTKRKPSAYAMYVKQNYSKVKDLPASQRFAALGKLWAAEKAK